jgi:Short C-terminal domain
MMMRRRAVMRRGPGLVGTVARTAVVAGTAATVGGAVVHHQQQKYQQEAEAEAAQQATYQNEAEIAAMQQQMAALQTQQVQAAVAAPAPAAAAPTQPDIIAQLQQLNQLKTAGALSEEEFAAAKAKLLGTG